MTIYSQYEIFIFPLSFRERICFSLLFSCSVLLLFCHIAPSFWLCHSSSALTPNKDQLLDGLGLNISISLSWRESLEFDTFGHRTESTVLSQELLGYTPLCWKETMQQPPPPPPPHIATWLGEGFERWWRKFAHYQHTETQPSISVLFKGEAKRSLTLIGVLLLELLKRIQVGKQSCSQSHTVVIKKKKPL